MYLTAAQNLKEGNGLFITDACKINKVYFAGWPAAYPLAIWITSTVTGFTVFWASKVLNTGILACIMLLYYKLFKSRIIFLIPVFFIDSWLLIASYTWSENLFILSLVLFIYAQRNFHTLPSWKNTLVVLIAALLAFSSRYMGIFILLPIAAAIVHYFFKRRKIHFVRLLFAFFSTVLFCTCYLLINRYHTGAATGFFRLPTQLFLSGGEESFRGLVSAAFYAVINELQLYSSAETSVHSFLAPISVVIFMAISFVYIRSLVFRQLREHDGLAHLFIISGIFWWSVVILLRFFMRFDLPDARLLGPGTVLLCTGLFYLISLLLNIKARAIYGWCIVAFSLSYCAIEIHTAFKLDNERINVVLFQLNKDYSILPPGSKVIGSEPQAFFLRTDISHSIPPSGLTFQNAMTEQVNCAATHIYIRKRRLLNDSTIVHPSFLPYLSKVKETEGFLRIK